MKSSYAPIIVIGLGPRGIGICLRLLDEGYKVIGIDPEPLQSWNYPNLINDMEMRSPTSFDLVSLCNRELRNTYSLNRYLSIYEDYESYKEYEECNHFIKRDIFFSYISHIYSVYIKNNSNFTLYRDRVIEVKGNQIRLSSNEVIVGTKIILAVGPGNKRVVPSWISTAQISTRLLSYKEVIENPPTGQSILVCGGGQAGAEYTKYLIDKGNFVYWMVRDKRIKVQQYPIPTYSDWQGKSCFSDYYRQLSIDPYHQIDYLKKVKAWGPSITPNIDLQLNSLKDRFVVIDEYDKQYNLSQLLRDCYGLILCTGFNSSISTLPLKDEIDLDPRNKRYPLLEKGFKSSNGYYFTGLLATLYDGPRQNSLFSIGLTSQEILEDINNSI